jgi:hypothetical protein
MATDKFSDDVDPTHREPLSVDGAAALRFPDRPLYDNQIRVFDDAEQPVMDVEEPAPISTPLITIGLTVQNQRAIIEHQVGEPCFRMWMSTHEWDRVKPVPDWTAYELSDGRIAVWRKSSELDAIMTQDMRLWSAICERILQDDVI